LNFPFYIAKRYLRSKSGNNAINIITIIATLGIIVATAVLFVVLSGFLGLKEFSLSFYKAADPDVKITASLGKTFYFTDSLKTALNNNSAIKSYTKVLEERAFFKYRNKEHIAYIKGVDNHYLEVIKLDSAIISGKWLNPNFPYGVVMGNGIANKLSLNIDYLEPLVIYVPKPGITYNYTNPSSLVSSIDTRNIGVFSILDEVDTKYVFANLPIAQELLHYSLNQISAISLKIETNIDSDKFAEDLQKQLGKNFKVQTRAQLNAVFYKMLNTENLVLYFIFTLVLVIALFNIIGAIIMMILDKKSNLKTLLNLGVTIDELKRIFVYQGFLLILFGLIVGLLLGSILIILQDHFHLFMINDLLAYPVVFSFQNMLIVIITMIILGFLAAKIASSRISEKLLNR
jgi:lipoprotein-releasing system permease protein